MKKILILCALVFLQSCAYRGIPKEEGSHFLEKRRADVFVVVDPGHGGKDDGCSGKIADCVEKDLAIKVAKIVQRNLEVCGIKTVLTRDFDEFISLEERAVFANQRNAKLFVSIHFNHADNTLANGVEVYFYEENTDRAEQSKNFAMLALDTILDRTGANSRGVKTEDLRVLRKTNMPAILIECGFLSNSEEAKKCKDTKYQKVLAKAISDAIEKYLFHGIL